MTRDRDPLEVHNNYYVPMVVEQSARGERGVRRSGRGC